LTIAKLNKTNGSEIKNLPPIASNSARTIDTIKMEILTVLVSFFEDALPIYFNNK
jgi:hypothetical protein